MEFITTSFLTGSLAILTRSLYFVSKDDGSAPSGKHKKSGKQCQQFRFQMPSWYRSVSVTSTGERTFRVTFNRILSPIFQVDSSITKDYTVRQKYGNSIFSQYRQDIVDVLKVVFASSRLEAQFFDIHVKNGDLIVKVTMDSDFDIRNVMTFGMNFRIQYDKLFKILISTRYSSIKPYINDTYHDDKIVCSLVLDNLYKYLSEYKITSQIESNPNVTVGYVIPSVNSNCGNETCCLTYNVVIYYHVKNPISSIMPNVARQFANLTVSQVYLDVLEEDADQLEGEYILKKIRMWLSFHSNSNTRNKTIAILEGKQLYALNCISLIYLNKYIRRCKGCLELYTVESYNSRNMDKMYYYNIIRNSCCRKEYCINCLQRHLQSSLDTVVNGNGSLTFPFTIKCPCVSSVEFVRLFRNHLILPGFLTDGEFKKTVIRMIKLIKETADDRSDGSIKKITSEEADQILDDVVRPSLEHGHLANKCPTCFRIIVKDDGCNAVVCPMRKCKTAFCIVCGVKMIPGSSQRCNCGSRAITGLWVEDHGIQIRHPDEIDEMPNLIIDNLALWRV